MSSWSRNTTALCTINLLKYESRGMRDEEKITAVGHIISHREKEIYLKCLTEIENRFHEDYTPEEMHTIIEDLMKADGHSTHDK